MKKWLEFNLTHPRAMLGILVVITIIAGAGLGRLGVNGSSEAIMPKTDDVYLRGLQSKKDFGDSKTFTLTAIEPADGQELFRPDVFQSLNQLVAELEEYKDFDLHLETKRQNHVLGIGGVTVVQQPNPQGSVNTSEGKNQTPADSAATKSAAAESAAAEAQLDALILGDSLATDNGPDEGVAPSKAKKPAALTPVTKLPPKQTYSQAHRSRYQFNYDNYQGVSLAELRAGLDAGGRRMLDTILATHHKVLSCPSGILCSPDSLDDKAPLSKGQYKVIVEAWEDLFLYKSMEIVDSLIDPISAEDIRGEGQTLQPVDLIPKDAQGQRMLPQSKKDFAAYKAKLLDNPGFKSTLYSLTDDGQIQALGMSIKLANRIKYDDFTNYLWPLIKKYDKAPLELTPMGSLIVDKFIADYMKDDLGVFMPFVILVIILTLLLNFRMTRGVLLPVATVVMGAIWTLGLMGWLGVQLTSVGNILPPLLIAIGSSYSIHIFNQYLIELDYIQSGDKRERLSGVMSHISVTVFLAAFTTFASFLTLTANQVTALREFGIFAALGTVFSVVISVILIPAALMILKVKTTKKTAPAAKESTVNPVPGAARNSATSPSRVKQGAVYHASQFFSMLSLNHPRAVVAVFLVVLVVSIYGITFLKTDTAPTKFFKPGSEMRMNVERISNVLDGATVLNLTIDSGRKNGAKDAQFLNHIEEIHRFLDQPQQKKDHSILAHSSFNDFIKRMHMSMNGGDPSYYKIPSSSTTIADYLEIYSGTDGNSDGRPDVFESTVDKDYRRVNMLVRLGEIEGGLEGTELARLSGEHILRFVNSLPGSKQYSAEITGDPMNFVALSGYVAWGQVLSLILSTLFVGLVVFLLFKSPTAGAVALLPISATVTIIFGIMGFADIPLDIAKAILSTIAIGIGVDDTIHFLNTLRKNLREGKDLREAIAHTHRMAGLAIVYTSAALVFGFGVLLVSRFTPTFHFGFLVSSVMAVTTIAALVVLPSVIYLLRLNVAREWNWPIFRYVNLSRFLEG